MAGFWRLLQDNPNYRYAWLGQLVSEVGDHFNTIAVLSLALHLTGSGLAVGGVMIARTLPAVLAGPLAGIVLDRMDRRIVMIASDLARAVVALGFVLILTQRHEWLMYVLSGLLMFASPFFTSGRSAILPRITRSHEELHTANAMTQTTAWLTLSIGTMLGGVSAMQFGYAWAFVFNSASFLFSAWAVSRLKVPEGHFRAERTGLSVSPTGWGDLRDSLRYIKSTPLVLAIGLAGIGWSSGGGAAQILFTLFGEVVFQKGSAGVGLIWSSAGIGLVIGGVLGHRVGRRLSFSAYRHTISACFTILGGSYILFSLSWNIWVAVVFILLSRIAMGANNVLNRTMLLTHVPDGYRGRVFSTVDMMMHTVMMLSMMGAGIASEYWSVRTIGVVAGALSASTAVFWTWASLAGKLREPVPSEPRDDDVENGIKPAGSIFR